MLIQTEIENFSRCVLGFRLPASVLVVRNVFRDEPPAPLLPGNQALNRQRIELIRMKAANLGRRWRVLVLAELL